jgi:hypothetical protein
MSETIIVNDSNFQEFADECQQTGMCGCLPRQSVYGSLPFAGLPKLPIIPWEEMPDRIADEERNKSSLEHLILDSELHTLNQNPYNWCWWFSAVQALMIERLVMGLPYVALSPSSGAGPQTNFRDVGGIPENAAAWLVDHGVASTAFVPETTINQRDFKPGWEQDRAKYRVTKWTDIPPNLQIQLSYLLQKKPCPNGRNFMKHSMCSIRALDRYPSLPASNPRRYGVKDWNSWGKLKTFMILEQGQATANQFYAIEQALFS